MYATGVSPFSLLNYERSKMKLASLFDGSGGFPLAAIRAGITPVWASDVVGSKIRKGDDEDKPE